jgi:hypothetical protein
MPHPPNKTFADAWIRDPKNKYETKRTELVDLEMQDVETKELDDYVPLSDLNSDNKNFPIQN